MVMAISIRVNCASKCLSSHQAVLMAIHKVDHKVANCPIACTILVCTHFMVESIRGRRLLTRHMIFLPAMSGAHLFKDVTIQLRDL